MSVSTLEAPRRVSTRVLPVDIVGAGVFTAAGPGLAAIPAALAAPPQALPAEVGWPDLPVLPAAGFDPAELLGRKGLSRLTRTDQLAMAACSAALLDAGVTDRPERTGVVLGTAFGSGSALFDFVRDTYSQDRPYLVNPSHFPGTLMNSAASRTAIKHALTGVNATLSGGPLAAMHALRYARQVLAGGHATRLLTGGVEELSRQAAWAWQRTGALAPDVPLGEAAAVFALDAAGPASRPGGLLGRLLACEVGYADPARGVLAVSGRLAACVHTALSRSGVTPGEVTVVAPGAAGRFGWAAVEERALRGIFPSSRRLRVASVLGETHSAGVAVQLAAVLAEPEPAGLAVLTTVGFDGSVGCAVVAGPEFTAQEES